MVERRHAWAVAGAVKETKRRFDEGWALLPRGALRRWLAVLAFGWALGAALALGLAVAGERLAGKGMARLDGELLGEIAADERFSFQTAIWFDSWGSSAMLVPLTLLAFVVAARARRPLVALSILAAYLLHDPLVWVGWTVWDRARPTLVAGGIAAPPLHAFPSGHAVQLIAVYGFLAYLWVRRSPSPAERGMAVALVAAVTLVVSYARLRMGTHWPSDIAAGVVLGTAWLVVCVLALRAGEGTAGRPPGADRPPPAARVS